MDKTNIVSGEGWKEGHGAREMVEEGTERGRERQSEVSQFRR